MYPSTSEVTTYGNIKVSFFLERKGNTLLDWKTRKVNDQIMGFAFQVTYKIDSMSDASSVDNLSIWDGFLNFKSLKFSFPSEASKDVLALGIAREDVINHWVAAAYWRHISFSFSIFCTKSNQLQKWWAEIIVKHKGHTKS